MTSGRPAWEVRVELPSHDDVVRLAGHLAARGWRVRPHRRHLIVGADCEDDAKSLARELSGDGRADADTAFRVRRVDIYPSWTTAEPLVAAVHDRGRLTLERQFVIMRVFGLVGGSDSSGGGLVPASPSGPVQLCRWCGQLPGQAGEQADLVAGQRRGTSVGICAPTSACPLESVIDCSPRALACPGAPPVSQKS